MINIRHAASAVAAVAVAGVTVQQIITRTRKDAVNTETPTTIVDSIGEACSAQFIAFNKAQDVISDRMLSGYYDDKTNDVAHHDFQILYTNFLMPTA